MSDRLTQTLIVALGSPQCHLPPQEASMAAWAAGKIGLKDPVLIDQVRHAMTD